MKHFPPIAFCTTCKGRVQHIEKTLPKNLEDNRHYPDLRHVLLDYNSQDHLADYLKANHQRDMDSGRLVVYSFPQAGPFRMAHAKNMAHRLGIREGASVLVNLDADNFTHHNFAGYVGMKFFQAASNAEDMFLWARVPLEPPEEKLPRGCSGRIVVSDHAFLLSGGYDEKYETWAPDDKDFNNRLRRMGYSGYEIPRGYLDAILHNDKTRFKEYKHAKAVMSKYEFDLVNSTNVTTVVNFGSVGVGTVYRNYSPDPIELAPIPTRIFGIGMHKTATTSLNAALKVLGYKAAHWKSAHWAKAIWTEMATTGKSPTLEHHYALSDFPIGPLYRALDAAYPGSKFILTVRREDSWLKSVENHWSHEHNPFRAMWKTDPFSNYIHRAVYGQTSFDREIFLHRYRQHNTEVKEFFRDRPGDLLVMDMDAGAGWDELCGFLKQPIPTAVDYPREFPTEKR